VSKIIRNNSFSSEARIKMELSKLLDPVAAYVDGKWTLASSGATFAVTNPANNQVLCAVPKLSGDETVDAVQAAERSLVNPTTIEQRSEWLSQLADLVLEHKRELGRIITLEHGKPWPEAISEAEYAASFFRYYADAVRELEPKQLPGRPRNHAWTVHYRPAGVVALITPWNFPLAMLAKKFSAALAADCASVVKPSSKTPLSMIALFSLISQIGLPPGKANLVLGSAGEIGDVLCTHSAVRVVSFTGSTEVGKRLMAMAAPHLKRLSLELGGNAPFIVFDDADLDRAADAFVLNKFRGAGQTCVCANRLYVHQKIASGFAARVAERVGRMRIGDGMNEGTDIGPLIDANARAKVQRHFDDALALGATCVAGGPSVLAAEHAAVGSYFPPTVLTGVTRAMACVNEETFGPLAPLLEFADEAEVIREANRTEYGLAAYLFTADDARAERVIARLVFGHVGHNTGTGPTAEAPFGGMKQSGFGREGGVEGLHDFVEPQSVPRP
jgi:succinate-semialdehyde dehydrogenase/glutarate-semialdehyde dehydrogenase